MVRQIGNLRARSIPTYQDIGISEYQYFDWKCGHDDMGGNTCLCGLILLLLTGVTL
jgi:hypothetical protein